MAVAALFHCPWLQLKCESAAFARIAELDGARELIALAGFAPATTTTPGSAAAVAAAGAAAAALPPEGPVAALVLGDDALGEAALVAAELRAALAEAGGP